MICISVIDLIPNSLKLIIDKYNYLNSLLIMFIAFIIGIIISNMFDDKIDSKSNNKLYKIGIITMAALIIHNIPEGIATYITTTNNFKLGLLFSISIALHNIPEGISISIPIYYSTNSKYKAFTYTFISGISELFGALITYLFFSKYINDIILGIIYSFIAGLMINISINKLGKESICYNKKDTILYFIIGIIIMLISHLMINN